ncbi:MAG TPA: HslU--HslV peptidase ATPase subunit, partial [Nitrospiria bacterium]|nr:HslU--HslV peptidase ATPase subunit [Nitrospiria bacterium]
QNALVKQYIALMATEGLTLEFTPDAVDEIASIAVEVNERAENIGARRLFTIMEKLLDDLAFDAPDRKEEKITIDGKHVRKRLDNVVKSEDLSRYIL